MRASLSKLRTDLEQTVTELERPSCLLTVVLSPLSYFRNGPPCHALFGVVGEGFYSTGVTVLGARAAGLDALCPLPAAHPRPGDATCAV